MKIYLTTPPTITVAAWLRRYATQLIVVALVGLATLGVGVAQSLYSNTTPRMSVSRTVIEAHIPLDQHERQAIAR